MGLMTSDDPRSDATPSTSRLREARKIIEREFASPLTLLRIARRVRLPRFAFQRAYEQTYGQSPMQYLRQVRLSEAAGLLAGGRNAHDGALLVGYTRALLFELEYRRCFRDDPERLRLLDP